MNRISKTILAFSAVTLAMASCSKGIPESWTADWENPAMVNRPMRITHGIGTPTEELDDYMVMSRDTLGLGGLVVSYAGDSYLQGEKGWNHLTESIRSAQRNGLRIWFYDEAGYPSLRAGGRVLEADPSLEAQELCYDASLPEGKRIFVRNSYEYTHACNNYSAARRYPDPGNPKAIRIFIEKTHQQLKERLGEDYKAIEAFFTDEPSYMAVNLGQIPEKVRKQMAVVDPIDPNRPLLPVVAWTEGIDKDYKELYGEDLTPHLQSLFMGDTEEDKQVRQKYWALVAKRYNTGYMDPLSEWCRNAGGPAVSSGHLLSEENLERHVPLYGNILEVEKAFDYPGLDLLDSEPSTWNTLESGQWLMAQLPQSAAYLKGVRRIMSEVSDHNQRVLADNPVTAEQMMAVAACQMAGGVTDFTLYYPVTCGERFPFRNEKTFKQYCDFVGKVNSVVLPADVVKRVLLYYPIYDFQREYLPHAEELVGDKLQSPKMQQLIRSFAVTGSSLMQAQVPYIFADYLSLEGAQVEDGKIVLNGKTYDSIVFSEWLTLPENVQQLVDACHQGGVQVVNISGGCDAAKIARELTVPEVFTPAMDKLSLGIFERDGRTVYLVANGSYEAYEGTLTTVAGGEWTEMDPHSGAMAQLKSVSADGAPAIPVSLAPLQTKLYVSE